MGPIGWQEMMFIFLLALVLFGPKKLPELGRMLGKAISEFRRAQSELKATFDREMQNLERETESTKEVTSSYHYDNYNYDYSSGDSGTYGEPYSASVTEAQDSTPTHTSTTSASATEGAESLSPVTPEGAIAHGTEIGTEVGTEIAPGNGRAPHEGAGHEQNGSLTAEHNA
jgi:sec-independent protein translocase protein TatA